MNKSQDERQTIERLYELLGWKDYCSNSWSHDPENQCRQVLYGCPPASYPSGRQVFPPSRQDGNGLLWLVYALAHLGFEVGVAVTRQDSEVVIDYERHGLRVLMDKDPHLPRKANKAAVEALEQRNA